MRIEEKCFARVGLMGNPSDGFAGKTLSALISNFYAQVHIESNESGRVEIFQSEELDPPTSYTNLDALDTYISKNGYYGVYRLMLATCKVFASLCIKSGLSIHNSKGFKLFYFTNIPRMVGLSGSSALIVAAFKALLRFYELTIEDLNITQPLFPQVILNIEKDELGISAGLQDRVIQTYGGVVHMNFDPDIMQTTGAGVYSTPISPSDLPHLYLAYNYKFGSDSGSVHSTVKARWMNQDPDLVAGMKRLGTLADLAVEAIQAKNNKYLASLMDENFAIRRRLYSDQVVGAINIAAIELMNSYGFGAKFSGSGGACICIRRDGNDWLDETKEREINAALETLGFKLIRLEFNY